MAAAQTQHRGIGRVPGGARWVVVVLLVAAAVRLGRSRGEKELVERHETVAVTRGPVEAKVTATGRLSALVTVQVGSQVSGRVAELLVDFNDTVRKGQVVARIDPRLFKAALAQAQANARAARAGVTKATSEPVDAARQARRMKELRARHLVALSDEETAVTKADAAKSTLAAADAAVGGASPLAARQHTGVLAPAHGSDDRPGTSGGLPWAREEAVSRSGSPTERLMPADTERNVKTYGPRSLGLRNVVRSVFHRQNRKTGDACGGTVFSALKRGRLGGDLAQGDRFVVAPVACGRRRGGPAPFLPAFVRGLLLARRAQPELLHLDLEG